MVDWWPCGGFKLVKACILRAAVNFALVGSGTRLRMKVKKKSSTVTTHCVHSTLLGEDWAFFIGGGGGGGGGGEISQGFLHSSVSIPAVVWRKRSIDTITHICFILRTETAIRHLRCNCFYTTLPY